MKKRIVILGGGSGGTMVANRLARKLDNEVKSGMLEIILITNMESHIYQPGYLYIALNEREPEHFIREQKRLMHRNITLIHDNIIKINKEKNILESANQSYPYDYLIISTGSYPDFNSIPGLQEASDNFYTLEGAIKLRDKLAQMKAGRILLTIGMPHKCPAAPLEIIFMLDDFFRKQGVRDQVELKYTYPMNNLHALPSIAEWVKPRFEKGNILTETNFQLEKVDPQQKVAITTDGKEHTFDILISIPAHTGAQVIMDSSIGNESGYIPTDKYTLKMKGSDNIYVIGDATDLPISKAGSTAHYQTEVVVPNLVNRIKGRPETARYNGKVACFLENGLEDASMITFDYNHPPTPVDASELIHWFKAVYNELYWLNARGIL